MEDNSTKHKVDKDIHSYNQKAWTTSQSTQSIIDQLKRAPDDNELKKVCIKGIETLSDSDKLKPLLAKRLAKIDKADPRQKEIESINALTKLKKTHVEVLTEENRLLKENIALKEKNIALKEQMQSSDGKNYQRQEIEPPHFKNPYLRDKKYLPWRGFPPHRAFQNGRPPLLEDSSKRNSSTNPVTVVTVNVDNNKETKETKLLEGWNLFRK